MMAILSTSMTNKKREIQDVSTFLSNKHLTKGEIVEEYILLTPWYNRQADARIQKQVAVVI